MKTFLRTRVSLCFIALSFLTAGGCAETKFTTPAAPPPRPGATAPPRIDHKKNFGVSAGMNGTQIGRGGTDGRP